MESNKYENLLKFIVLQTFQNNLGFNLCVLLYTYHLIITSEVEMEFNKESTNKNKYIDLISEISISSMETIVNYQTEYLQIIY